MQKYPEAELLKFSVQGPVWQTYVCKAAVPSEKLAIALIEGVPSLAVMLLVVVLLDVFVEVYDEAKILIPRRFTKPVIIKLNTQFG